MHRKTTKDQGSKSQRYRANRLHFWQDLGSHLYFVHTSNPSDLTVGHLFFNPKKKEKKEKEKKKEKAKDKSRDYFGSRTERDNPVRDSARDQTSSTLGRPQKSYSSGTKSDDQGIVCGMQALLPDSPPRS